MEAGDDLATLTPIVGIGASAGGLEATSELLEGLRGTTRIAGILVQHLDPSHESLLSDILAKKTDLTVVSAYDGATVEAGHLYVLPPDKVVTIEHGRLRLIGRERYELPHTPIDTMLHSLALEQGANSVAVILSGTGSDGSRGLAAIKGAGGITFAQDEVSAKFGGMPRSAIATECVDFVLPPGEIANELKRITSHPHQKDTEQPAAGPLPKGDDEKLGKILQFLRNHTGIDFSHYKRSTILRRLERRMAVIQVEDLARYSEVLRDNSTEAKALAQDFLIAVTRFFRDTKTLEELMTTVFPALVASRPAKESIRIWVPGCATGEEAYSIAIELTEFLENNHLLIPIQIFGTDLSDTAIERARIGTYVSNVAVEVSPERLRRFFVKLDDHYRVTRALREICVFARHDVTRDPPFSHLDLISSQNLLIYLEHNLQRQVLRRFHYALRPNGFLVLGPSESIGHPSELFQLASRESRIYRRQSSPTQSGFEPELHHRTLPPTQGAKTPVSIVDHEHPQRETERILLARYAPACILVNEDLNVIYFQGDTSHFLEHARGPASLNLSKLVRPGLLIELSNAIRQARETNAPVRKERIHIQVPDAATDANLEVIPVKLRDADTRFYLILFERLPQIPRSKAWSFFARWLTRHGARPRLSDRDKDDRIRQLEHQLEANTAFLQDAIEKHETAEEELRAAHEEAMSANEEMQSINEELETAKEELQSSNEELVTTNEELLNRNRELRESIDALGESRNYLSAIIETMRESLLVLDGDLRIITANHAFYEHFGVKPQGTISGLLYELGNGQWNIPRLRMLLEEILPDSRSLRDFEVTIDFPGLGKRTMALNGLRLEGDSRRPARILLAIEDITERNMALSNLERALQSLQEEDRRTNEFLAVLAHELRNPLAPIRTAIELMRKGATAPAEATHLDIIDGQAGRMARLVDDLLEISRVNQGSIVLRKERADLGAVVNRVADATRQQPSMGQGRSFVVSLPPSPLYILGDAIRVEQIISNLLDNAVKFTDAKGRISVRLERHRDQAVIRVADDGMGIGSEALPHIFKPFFQADSSFGRKHGGLGIGLTLVKRLVELHGGDIEVKSGGLDQGSEFIVRLPVASGPEVHPESKDRDGPGLAASALQSPDSDHHRVLIVEDHTDGADILAELVESWGHKAAVAYEGRSALEVAGTFAPDIVVLDIGLPGMDGLSVARELRQLPNGQRLRLIAMTGHAREEDRKASREAGFDTHLVKPVDFGSLRSLLGAKKQS